MEEPLPTIVVGSHHRVREMPHFDPKDGEERAIPGFQCQDCETWKPSRSELQQVGCRRRPK